MNASSVNEPRKYLIAIGSPYCPNITLDPLERVNSDIQKINNIFTTKEQGYKSVLTEISSGCTSKSIKSQLRSWFKSSERSSSDQVIVYYAGHGDDGQEYGSHYLYTVESKRDDLDSTAIETSDLTKCLFPGKQNSPRNVLLILDVCYAGQGANNTVVSSLTQCRSATENVSFWIIASADSKTEAGDGDFVDALEEAMKDDNWKQKDKDEFIAIDQLIGCINTYFKKNQKTQQAEGRCIKSYGQSTFIRNPFFSNPNQFESDEHKLKKDLTKTKSPHQTVAELLWFLDYSAQEQDFKNVMQNGKERAFLVQTNVETIQYWLVRRLAGCVPDFEQAKKFSIRIRSHPMRSDFNAFWQEFQQEIGDNLKRETVIQELAKLCQKKSVIIAIYGLSSLDQAKVEEFYVFWSNLVDEVRLATQRSFRSRLVLLLAEKNSSTVLDKLRIFNFIQPPTINETQYSISLTPLDKILREDVTYWLAQEKVYSLLEWNDNEIESIVNNDIAKWEEEPLDEPLDVLQEICRTVFQIQDGIAAIEPYWKLAG